MQLNMKPCDQKRQKYIHYFDKIKILNKLHIVKTDIFKI